MRRSKSLAFHAAVSSPPMSLMRERIGAQLEVHDQWAGQGLARSAGTGRVDAFDVHGRSVARGHPQSPALPAGFRIVDAAVHALGEEAHRVRDAELDNLPIRQRVERIREVARTDGGVRTQAQNVVLIHPAVVGTFSGAVPAGERWSGERIKRPAFRAQVPLGRSRPVETPLALAAVRAGQWSAPPAHPRPALAVAGGPAASRVSQNIFVLTQPTMASSFWRLLLSHSVLLASSAKFKWCVPKHVSMNVNCLLFGSYTVIWREFWTNPSGVPVSGYPFADEWPDAAAQ